MDEYIESVINSIPLIRALYPFDCMIAVADKNEIVFYSPGDKVRHDDPRGKRLEKGDGLWEAVNYKQTVTSMVSAGIFGFEFKNISTPLINQNGEVVGAVGLGHSVELQEKLQETAKNIAAYSQNIIASSQELMANAGELHDQIELLRKEGDLALESIDKSDKILSVISGIASSTNLLGLNASIEASKAGITGRGFSVVADEIRKLSQNSTLSAKQIKEALLTIRNDFGDIDRMITDVDEISLQQASATQEIVKAIEGLSELADGVRKTSEKI
jgi:methyl-accepting chemotaxis protein